MKVVNKNEQGATLIVVLVVLILITIIGVLAIRVALTSLNISANAQLAQLMGQTADAPLNQFLNEDLSKITALSGVIGYAIEENKSEPGKEYIFCYRPLSNERFGSSLGVTTLRIPESPNDRAKVATGGAEGFCNLKEDFGSSRKAVVTQVAVKVINTTESAEDLEPGALLAEGINLSAGAPLPKNVTEQNRIRVTTTSIVPAYASNLEAAQACIGKDATAPGYINDNSEEDTKDYITVATCLASIGVPVNSQAQEFNLKSIFTQVEAP